MKQHLSSVFVFSMIGLMFSANAYNINDLIMNYDVPTIKKVLQRELERAKLGVQIQLLDIQDLKDLEPERFKGIVVFGNSILEDDAKNREELNENARKCFELCLESKKSEKDCEDLQHFIAEGDKSMLGILKELVDQINNLVEDNDQKADVNS